VATVLPQRKDGMAGPRKTKSQQNRGSSSGRPPQAGPPRSTQSSRNIRETIESIVIAFVLAFLFRTFEAEAFVIPTGSMAPTLQGMHKDVDCPECGYRYQASASIEAPDERQQRELQRELRRVEDDLRRLRQMPRQGELAMEEGRLRKRITRLREQMVNGPKIATAACPMCLDTMRADDQPTFNGDRILVNKFVYDVRDPRRWEVIVFKYPGDAKMNYIKRLIGLPNETVRIYQGDIFIKPGGEDRFDMARKSPDLTRATLQDVHDNRYVPRELVEKKWPFRWQVWPPSDSPPGDPPRGGWVASAAPEGDHDVHQVFTIDGTATATEWIRYRHLVPSGDDWERMQRGPLSPAAVAQIRPQLITDFYAYNTSMTRDQGPTLQPPRRGLHWVGDLLVEVEVIVKKAAGELLLDLVEGGKHFTATVDLGSGQAGLSIEGFPEFAPRATTRMRAAGNYHLAFANVNDQLLLWIDDHLVEFDTPTTYDASAVFGDRQQIRPQSTTDDAGDLAPVGVGAKAAAVEVTGLKIRRDRYYIADRSGGHPITDYDPASPPIVNLSVRSLANFLADPTAWQVFTRRRSVEFPLSQDQFFVLGDNSPFSKDGRLWPLENFGHYVERQLLIGRAMFVYWPHSWNRIPGTPIPFPFFPNFADMRLVR
jgi:signal peptidase I